MSQSIVYLNGDYLKSNEAKISIFDRGLLFADSVYEVIPFFNNKVLLFDEHLKRLNNNLAMLKINYATDKLQSIFEQLIAKNNAITSLKHFSIYTQITRGNAETRTHDFVDWQYEPNIIMLIQPNIDIYFSQTPVYFKVKTFEDDRWQKSYIKTTNLLSNVLCKTQALEDGFDEIIYIKGDKITESSSMNVAMVKNGVVFFPNEKNTLPGITRLMLEKICSKYNIEYQYKEINLSELFEADEVFLTSSNKNIVIVSEIDDIQLNINSSKSLWNKINQGIFEILNECKN